MSTEWAPSAGPSLMRPLAAASRPPRAVMRRRPGLVARGGAGPGNRRPGQPDVVLSSAGAVTAFDG